MSQLLNSKKGRCQGTVRLSVTPVKAVVELGAGMDVFNPVLKAAHHLNRNASEDDYIAVSLPEMHQRRTGMASGFEVELYGSEKSLAAFLMLELSKSLTRRGMVEPLVFEEAYFDEGTEGTAFIRDRLFEKMTSGWIKRAKARAERRGKPWVDKKTICPKNSTVLPLHYGSKIVHIKQQAGYITDKPLLVSTYGFSSSVEDGAAVLPVVPPRLAELAHAV